MTVEPLELQSSYTIAGTGPYAIQNPYGTDEITAKVDVSGTLTDLVAGVDYTVSPSSSETTGDLTLSVAAAVAHMGAKLLVDRTGLAQQGFLGVAGSREKGLEAQLDAMTRRIQEVQRDLARAIRVTAAVSSFVAQAGRSIVFDDQGNPVAGPTADEISAAEGHAATASAARTAAEAARDAAIAAENSKIEWQGAWLTATAYAPSDIVRVNGSSYVCLLAHTSGTFSTDLAAGRWEIFAQKGDPGAGTGDVVAANNLGDLDDADTALANLGGSSVGIAAFKAADAADARTALELGSAATADAGTGPDNLVQLDGTGKLPALDGSNLTNVATAAKVSSGVVSWVAAGLITVAHGKAGAPDFVVGVLQCKVATNNWLVGDRVQVNLADRYYNHNGTTWSDATNIYLRVGSSGNFLIHNKTTGVAFAAVPAQWDIEIVGVWL